MAPRVHNSGHWTIEGAETSQFENHLRAVLGLPLGRHAPRGHAAMINLIGTHAAARDFFAVPGVHFHDYGKEPATRPQTRRTVTARLTRTRGRRGDRAGCERARRRRRCISPPN